MIKAGLTKRNPPKLHSDNGSCYIVKELTTFRQRTLYQQVHGKPLHPQTQGKIERYHRSMRNVVKLHNHYCPSELEKAIGEYVEFYNNKRYHKFLLNLTPSDVYWRRDDRIQKIRQQIKEQTIRKRKDDKN